LGGSVTLVVALVLPTADGPRPWSRRSASAHQRLKSQRSAVMAIVHLMHHQMLDKAVMDGPAVHPGRSARTLKCILPNLSPLGFSSFSRTGRSALCPRWCSLLLRTFYSVDTCFCSVPIRSSPWCHGRSAIRARMVRAQVNFQKASHVRNNLQYSVQST
jgi:hypothetical protein